MGRVEFRSRDEVQAHHDRARVRWEIHTPGDKRFATGTDVLSIGNDGLVESVASFIDQAPVGFDPAAHHDA